jgi:hypothetical protein
MRNRVGNKAVILTIIERRFYGKCEQAAAVTRQYGMRQIGFIRRSVRLSRLP